MNRIKRRIMFLIDMRISFVTNKYSHILQGNNLINPMFSFLAELFFYVLCRKQEVDVFLYFLIVHICI